MSQTKPVAILFIRSLFHQKGPEAEKEFLARLPPEELHAYHQALPVSWYPTELINRIIKISAPLIHPGLSETEALRRLGHDGAYYDLKGIYQIFMQMASPEAIIKKAAKLWSTLNAQGRAHAELLSEHCAVLVVEDIPEFPEEYRQVIVGYIQGVLEMTRAKDITVTHDDRNPNAWRWSLSWS